MIARHSSGAQCDNAPGYHDSANPDPWSEVLEQDVARKLHQNVWNEEHSNSYAVSIPGYSKLLDHIVLWYIIVESPGVSEIDSVQVVYEVASTDPR